MKALAEKPKKTARLTMGSKSANTDSLRTFLKLTDLCQQLQLATMSEESR